MQVKLFNVKFIFKLFGRLSGLVFFISVFSTVLFLVRIITFNFPFLSIIGLYQSNGFQHVGSIIRYNEEYLLRFDTPLFKTVLQAGCKIFSSMWMLQFGQI